MLILVWPCRVRLLLLLWFIQNQNQVGIGMVMRSDGVCRVAVIGGGIAGLSCARAITSKSSAFDVTVFDTGRLRPGGRCSSRLCGDSPSPSSSSSRWNNRNRFLSSVVIDHAAQILTVPSGVGFSSFQQQVEEWEQQGILSRFPESSVVEIRSSIAPETTSATPIFVPVNGPNDRAVMFYGTNGMGSIPLTMAKGLAIEQDIWVSPSYGARFSNGKWKLSADGGSLGEFDMLVIAHNGKCADRLLSKSPAKRLHSLLRVNFQPSAPRGGGNKMTLNSIYSLVFCVPKSSSPLSTAFPYISGFIRNEPNLSFLSCNSRKYSPRDEHEKDNNNDNNVEVWTLLSSANFAKQYKAPQEFLSDQVVANVTSLMLSALERSLSLPRGTLSVSDWNSDDDTIGDNADDSNRNVNVLESRLQLWGAAVPVNVWKNDYGFCYDAEYHVGVCGDWLLHPSIAGAWESGHRLGHFLSTITGGGTVGLPPDDGEFQAVSTSASSGNRRVCIGSL